MAGGQSKAVGEILAADSFCPSHAAGVNHPLLCSVRAGARERG